MNLKILLLLNFICLMKAGGFTDESHYSEIFGETRFFRVFTPTTYNAANSQKKYGVIYYFHGCGGSYQQSGTYSYADHDLKNPDVAVASYHPSYEYPNNLDFEDFVKYNEVIIVSVDGKIDQLPGCGVYFPSQVDSWKGNGYNFSSYIRELISVVDDRYNTLSDAQHRAISGLSMGGHMALWVAATNPHLFNSISEFCHSPAFYDVGEPSYLTTVDIMQLWRNFRGLPLRHTTTDRDYLRYYTEQLYSVYKGAGFYNEYYLADYCKHHAARVDLQFSFHLDSFARPKPTVDCFSHINLYPDFDIWGYRVSSSKKGNGWLYLRDVTRNGLGVYTRKRLPFGNSLSDFDIIITTPATYTPYGSYEINRYSYRSGEIDGQLLKADGQGSLKINSSGGTGEEIGIVGEDLNPPIFILTDTINETSYIRPERETFLSFEVVNLSPSDQTVDFGISTENDQLIHLLKQPSPITIPARSKIRVDSMFSLIGVKSSGYNNTGYIEISASIDGLELDRETLIQVVVKDPPSDMLNASVKIFDGRTEELTLFKYDWNGWDQPVTADTVSEGVGNGNGKAEMGEVFSLWIGPKSIKEPLESSTWHPTMPINGRTNLDIQLEEIELHRFNTGRALLSGLLSLNRKPTRDSPVRIPLQLEWLKVQHLEDDCHRNTADYYNYSFYDLVIYEDGSAEIE